MIVSAFSAELRRQCSKFPSISKVCEGTGINRQQFNKYLAGQAYPSARNMRKICHYLAVSEEQLLSGQTSASTVPAGSAHPLAAHGLYGRQDEIDLGYQDHPDVESAGEWLCRGPGPARPAPLPAGHFHCYFPLHRSSDLLLRSLITLKIQVGRMIFVRRTHFNIREGGDRFASRAKHQGIVVSASRETFLIGSNTLPPHQPSILSFQTEPVAGRVYYTGLALTRGPESQMATTVILHYLGSEKYARHALANLGTVSRTDSSLDPVVARLTQAQAEAGQSHIQWLDARSLLTGSLAGGSNLAQSKAGHRLYG